MNQVDLPRHFQSGNEGRDDVVRQRAKDGEGESLRERGGLDGEADLIALTPDDLDGDGGDPYDKLAEPPRLY